jgi:hypothetical protein
MSIMMLWVRHNMHTITNTVNKSWALLQTAGGRGEPKIVCMRKSLRRLQHGTRNIKIYINDLPTYLRQTFYTKYQSLCVWYYHNMLDDPGLHTITNIVNKTWALLQTAGGRDEPKIVCMRKSLRRLQHGTRNIKTHNRTTQKNSRNTVSLDCPFLIDPFCYSE